MKKESLQALIVDDSRANRLVIRRFMVDLAFQVTEAADGTEALAFIKKKTKYDLVLVDWDIPGMSGLDLIRKVRGDTASKETPIIMLSTQQTKDRMLKAIEAGANEYIHKPFTKEALEAKLDLLGIDYD